MPVLAFQGFILRCEKQMPSKKTHQTLEENNALHFELWDDVERIT